MRGEKHVVIIGAGIIGAAAAYFLSQAGVAVTIVEGEAPSAGATGASDGAVSVASKRPGPMMALAQRARSFYRQLEDNGPLSGLYHPRPTYLIARNGHEVALIEAQARELNMAQETTQMLDRGQLLATVPGLSSSVEGAVAVCDDGHALGYEIATRFLQLSGARVLRHTPALDIVTSNGRAQGVMTSAGMIEADAVLVAAGLGSGALIGLSDVLIPRKGQMAITDRAVATGPAFSGHLMSATYLETKSHLVGNEARIGLVIDPLKSGQFLIGSSREDNRTDRETDVQTISAILSQALALYPALGARRVIRTFAGIRTACRDGLPLVGRHPEIDGVTIATGFEGDGICLGPLMGSVAADLVLTQRAPAEISMLDPARFWPQQDMPQRAAQ